MLFVCVCIHVCVSVWCVCVSVRCVSVWCVCWCLCVCERVVCTCVCTCVYEHVVCVCTIACCLTKDYVCNIYFPTACIHYVPMVFPSLIQSY